MKVVFGIIAILIIVFGWRHIKRGVWIAPNPLYPDSWTLEWDDSEYARAMATPPQGYGWRHYDFWNEPPIAGEPIRKSDFRLRKQR